MRKRSAKKIGSGNRTGGPRTPEGKAKSLANLKAPWKPGVKPEGAGTPQNAGLSLKQTINSMQAWPREEYLKIIQNQRETGVRIAAARVWYHATSEEMNAGGTPVAGADFDRICDRTDGKPLQSHDIVIEQKPSEKLEALSVDELRTLRELRAKMEQEKIPSGN